MKYERFTVRNPDNKSYRIPACRGGSFRTEWQQDQTVVYGNIVDRLGIYEDLRSPEELAELLKRYRK